MVACFKQPLGFQILQILRPIGLKSKWFTFFPSLWKNTIFFSKLSPHTSQLKSQGNPKKISKILKCGKYLNVCEKDVFHRSLIANFFIFLFAFSVPPRDFPRFPYFSLDFDSSIYLPNRAFALYLHVSNVFYYHSLTLIYKYIVLGGIWSEKYFLFFLNRIQYSEFRILNHCVKNSQKD